MVKGKYNRPVIGFASFLLLCLIVIQFFYVKNAYELKQDQFSYEVTQSLLSTLDFLQKTQGDSSIILNPVVQTEPHLFVVKIHYVSSPYLLESLIRLEFKKNALDQDFVLNIYDCFSDSVVYSKDISLINTDIEANAPEFSWDREQGHYFSVYFPNQVSESIFSLEFWLLSTIALIIEVLFFTYLVWQLSQQRRISKLKTEFINNMTHEFKTPLSTIAISVNALKRPNITDQPETLKRYAEIIESENFRLQEQVTRILRAATIEKEGAALKNEAIDVHTILNDALNTFKMNIETKGGVLRTNFHAVNSVIFADKSHITNVFHNLIDNAIKYSPKELNISISTENVGNKIHITVKDSGLGIASAHQDQVFEKFYRVPTGNRHDVKGFGIGLNYVHLIVQKQGGSIKLNSKLGKGSAFTVSFKFVS